MKKIKIVIHTVTYPEKYEASALGDISFDHFRKTVTFRDLVTKERVTIPIEDLESIQAYELND